MDKEIILTTGLQVKGIQKGNEIVAAIKQVDMKAVLGQIKNMLHC
jgi:hypothetical protein